MARDAAAQDPEGQRRTGCGDLIEAIRPVYDQAAGQSELRQRACHQFGRSIRRRTHKLDRRARRIRQRPEQVEDRAHPQLGPHRLRVLHGHVNRRRKQKGDADIPQRLGNLLRLLLDLHAQRFHQVGAAAAAGDRPVAVLGHGDSASGDHKGGDGGDIEGAGPVPARAAGIEQHACDAQRRGGPPHGPRKAHELVDALAFHAQRHEERSNLRLGCFAGKDHLHGRLRIDGREVAALGHLVQEGNEGHVIL